MRKQHPLHYLVWILILCGFSGAFADNSNLPVSSPGVSQPAMVLAPNLAGTETRLFPAGYDIWACDWSPGGKALVFAGKVQGEDSMKLRVWYQGLDPASDPVLLTNTDQLVDFAPRWSPDGTKIAIARRSFKSNVITSSIWLKEMAGGAGKPLTIGPEDRDPAWSPDGTQIVFTRSQGPYKASLMAFNIADANAKVLLAKEGELLNNPWWGKDGKIYFTKFTPGPKTVQVSGQAYSVMDFGKGSIWALDPADNTVAPVVVDDYDNRTPVLSPDGSKLAFVSDRNLLKDGSNKLDRGGLYIKDLKNNQIYFVTGKVGLSGASLTWSPDGKKIAFFTFRSIRPSVWVIALP
jgi:Tol biopolymer transport system component